MEHGGRAPALSLCVDRLRTPRGNTFHRRREACYCLCLGPSGLCPPRPPLHPDILTVRGCLPALRRRAAFAEAPDVNNWSSASKDLPFSSHLNCLLFFALVNVRVVGHERLRAEKKRNHLPLLSDKAKCLRSIAASGYFVPSDSLRSMISLCSFVFTNFKKMPSSVLYMVHKRFSSWSSITQSVRCVLSLLRLFLPLRRIRRVLHKPC